MSQKKCNKHGYYDDVTGEGICPGCLKVAAPYLYEALVKAETTMNGVIRFLLGTGPQSSPEEMSEIVVEIDSALGWVKK